MIKVPLTASHNPINPPYLWIQPIVVPGSESVVSIVSALPLYISFPKSTRTYISTRIKITLITIYSITAMTF